MQLNKVLKGLQLRCQYLQLQHVVQAMTRTLLALKRTNQLLAQQTVLIPQWFRQLVKMVSFLKKS